MSGRILCLAGMLWLTAGASALWPAETVKEAGAEMQRRAEEVTLKLLSGVSPKSGDPKENSRLIDNCYVLWGEILEPGRVNALVGLDPQGSIKDGIPKGLVLALWNSASWQLEQVIDVPIFWKSPSIPQGDRQFLPGNLPDQAFWVCPLGPARQPVLVVSTPHSRYGAGRFVLEYDPDSHRLNPTPHFSVSEPAWREGYVVLTGDSGRKAWWTEQLFYQSEDNRLKFRGALRTGSYNAEDFFIHVTIPSHRKLGEAHWCFLTTPEDQAIHKIYAGENDLNPTDEVGQLRFLKPDRISLEDRGPYILQKLTGIPAGAVRLDEWQGDKRIEVPAKPIADADVEVHGTPEVLRLLGRDKAVK
jgi:hypothetical protein